MRFDMMRLVFQDQSFISVISDITDYVCVLRFAFVLKEHLVVEVFENQSESN